jgi:pSer/pThr/pTyr-binding forkhead associated (FHA) protein/uncharacterized RDD family membrane protein YckC
VAKLIINPTSGAKKEIPVGDKVLSIGRDPSNDLVLSDSMVSRRHAVLERRQDQYLIRDNNSSNGTMVNGDKVAGDQELRDGDLIAIGSARLLFQTEPGLAATAATPIPEVPKPVSAPAEGGTDEASKCPSCGLEVSTDDKFCRRCGKDLPARSERQVVCGNCGAAVEMPAEFCRSCGKPMLAQPARHNVPTEPRPWTPTGHEGKKPPPPIPKPGGPPPRPSKDKPTPERSRGPRPFAGKGKPAGFWIRLAAYLVDSVILSLPMLIAVGIMIPLTLQSAQAGIEPSPLVFLLPSLGGALVFLLSILYPIFFWTRRGATPGKMLFRLVVETTDGKSPLEIGPAVIRLVGYFINGFTFGIGFLLIAFSEDQRGLHDRLADTRVVKRQ